MALKWLHNLKNSTGRLAKWALELLELDYEVIYKKGSSNLVPDALSRSNETEKTHARISEYYCWPGLCSAVIKYVGKCKICQRTKPSNQQKLN